MKLPQLIALLAAAVLVLFAIRYFDFGSSSESSPQTEKVTSSIDRFKLWHDYRSEDDSFVVRVPRKPEKAGDKVYNGKFNDTLKYRIILSESSDDSLYMITVIEYPESVQDENKITILDETVSDLLNKNLGNVLDEKKEAAFKHHEAITFKLHNDETVIAGVTFFDKNKQYLLTAAAKNELFDQEDFDYFISSFELNDSSAIQGEGNSAKRN